MKTMLNRVTPLAAFALATVAAVLVGCEQSSADGAVSMWDEQAAKKFEKVMSKDTFLSMRAVQTKAMEQGRVTNEELEFLLDTLRGDHPESENAGYMRFSAAAAIVSLTDLTTDERSRILDAANTLLDRDDPLSSRAAFAVYGHLKDDSAVDLATTMKRSPDSIVALSAQKYLDNLAKS